MPNSNSTVLAPVVGKLTQHSQLALAEIDALLDLPFRIATFDPGSYLVREGDRTDSSAALLSGFVYRSKIAGSGARCCAAMKVRQQRQSR